MKTGLLIFFLFSLYSCSQFATHRSYLTEMENEDHSYFNPRKDFPVVAGDTGRDWDTDEERRERIPLTQDELYRERNTLALEEELESLQSKQSDNSLEFYERYKNHLVSTSEKIYFLKLPAYERKDYLTSRGIMIESPFRSPASSYFGRRNQDLNLGMTKDNVRTNWGRPERVEVAGNPSHENERWLYRVDGASKYIYFESGRVDGWE